MPLVVFTGYPCSLKSTRAQQLVEYFKSEHPETKTVLIKDGDFSGFSKDTSYSSARLEKDLRGYLKSEVQKSLNKSTLVVLDSLNYIKGYRYELYCITKSSQTPHCVVWCDISCENASSYNQSRTDDKYPDSVLQELMMRYEQPNPSSRWDCPLFTVQVDDQLPLQTIDDTLFKSKPPPPNMSTVAQPLQPTDFMYQLDKTTSEIVKLIINCQKMTAIGDCITVSAGAQLKLTRQLSVAELNKLRRQFITYMKMNPINDITKLNFMFTQYLQSALQ